MKRRILQNSVVIATLTVCLSAAVLVTSCQKDSFEDELSSPQSSKTKAGLPYLEFSADYKGCGSLSNEGKIIIMEAMSRIKVTKVNGLWQMDISSASAINVSQEVFGFLTQTIENSNADILPNLSTVNIAPRLKKPGDLDQNEDNKRSDCVAQCVGWIYNNLTRWRN